MSPRTKLYTSCFHLHQFRDALGRDGPATHPLTLLFPISRRYSSGAGAGWSGNICASSRMFAVAALFLRCWVETVQQHPGLASRRSLEHLSLAIDFLLSISGNVLLSLSSGNSMSDPRVQVQFLSWACRQVVVTLLSSLRKRSQQFPFAIFNVHQILPADFHNTCSFGAAFALPIMNW